VLGLYSALWEDFRATLECELLHPTDLSTQAEAQRVAFDSAEGWNNIHQLHSALGYEAIASSSSNRWDASGGYSTPSRYEKRYAERIAV